MYHRVMLTNYVRDPSLSNFIILFIFHILIHPTSETWTSKWFDVYSLTDPSLRQELQIEVLRLDAFSWRCSRYLQ